MNVTEDAVSGVVSVPLNVFPQLEVRYSDGYKAAKAIVGFGNLVKFLGAVAGVIIVLVSLSMSGALFVGGAVLGGLVWLGLFVGGVVICAQGQLLLATLDSAVNNSPFLDNSQRALIMSLSESVTSLSEIKAEIASAESPQVTGIRCRDCNSPSVVLISPKQLQCQSCGLLWQPLVDLTTI